MGSELCYCRPLFSEGRLSPSPLTMFPDILQIFLKRKILCLNAGQDEEWLYDSDMLDKDDRQRELLLYQPPDESKLSALRETKIREKQLKNKFIKLGDYLFILLVLVLVSYGNRDPKSFLMRNSMEQEFIRPLTASYPQGLDDVSLMN